MLRRFAVGFAVLACAAAVACDEESSEPVAPEVQQLRRATDRFHNLNQALSEGYAAFGTCFSDPAMGGMGQHYANDPLIGDTLIDLEHPELLLYETNEFGTSVLVGVEYIVFQAAWHAAGHTAPPTLLGKEFGLNTTLLPEPFYLLHAWVWKHNPEGMLADWNPSVHCR